MSATDELRAELTRRGVEFQKCDTTKGCFTLWRASGIDAGFDDMESWEQPHLLIIGFTPAQAIAATLGAGTCQLRPWEMERDTGFYDCMECDCGYVADVADWAEWHYCPRCGRKLVTP